LGCGEDYAVKKILLCAAVFIAVFFISLLFFLPFDKAAEKAINTVIIKNRLPLTYKEVNSGLFSTTVSGVELHRAGQTIELGDPKLRYSPLSLISGKVSAELENAFGTVKISNAGKSAEAEAVLDAARISKVLSQDAAGVLNIKAKYDFTLKTGSWEADSTQFAVQTPLMKVTGKSLKAGGAITENVLMVQNFSAEGDLPLKLTGQIRIDTVNIAASRINLSGEVSLYGNITGFILQGTLLAPKFQLR
jgi:hypothetical protein